jgi:hypothetical protein
MRAWGVIAILAVAFPATAQAQTGGTAPAYPGNTFKIEAAGPLVGGRVERVKLSGHAQWNEPTGTATIDYTLAMYVQNGDVDPACSPTYSGQLQKSINLPGLNAAASISGFVVDSTQRVSPAPPALALDWAGDSLPFAVKPGLDNVLLCGYVRYVTDDVAWYQLPIEMRQPSCRAVRSTVRRGSRLRLQCNVSGTAKVRFSGPRRRTVPARISPKDGSVSVPTGRLRAGTYRVSVETGDLVLAKSLRVRIR